MEFSKLIHERYSVRNYSSAQVPKDEIIKIVNAAIAAPTAANKQPFKIVVVDDPTLVASIKEAYPRDWFQSVKQLFVIFGNHQTSWKRADGKDHCDIDVAIVVDHMTLMAHSLGIGNCWVCNFDAKKVATILSAPDYLEPVVLLPFGYPGDIEKPQKKRLDIGNLLSWNSL
ncbi:MAG: nitroreductase family protein [Breznakibacter sp.]|nr:nitroreductase family protein [Breznakibacter sp.]